MLKYFFLAYIIDLLLLNVMKELDCTFLVVNYIQDDRVEGLMLRVDRADLCSQNSY